MVYYLSRTDWPMVSGSGSFQSKYWPTGSGSGLYDSNRLTQFALEIIDYVRCKESTNIVVPPLQGYYSSSSPVHFTTDTSAADGGRRPDCYRGLTRTPFITEAGLWFDHVTTPPFNTELIIEFYLPANMHGFR